MTPLAAGLGLARLALDPGLVAAVLARSAPGAARDDQQELRRLALLVWSTLAEPGDGVAGALIAELGALQALRAVWPPEPPSGGAAAAAAHRVSEAYRALGAGEAPEGVEAGFRRWAPRMQAGVVTPPLLTAARSRAVLMVPGDPAWPAALDDLGPHAPLMLWCLGEPALLSPEHGSVAVVGARSATGYGTHVTTELVAGLAERSYGIVSGAAYGIDGAAHRAALAAGGITIAVLAGGLDRFYPAGHQELLERIARDGAVVTEAPFGTAPSSWRFLQRNRSIAALGRATVVVEAGVRSGSLNTARHAITLGRELGAVPGPVTSPSSAGCHLLLREFDAECVSDAVEVDRLVRLGKGAGSGRSPGEPPPAAGGAARISQRPTAGENRDGSGDAGSSDRRELDPRGIRVLDALSTRAPRTLDELAIRSGLSVGDVGAVLGLLALDGRARRNERGWVSVPRGR